jgi:hypothetical protein
VKPGHRPLLSTMHARSTTKPASLSAALNCSAVSGGGGASFIAPTMALSLPEAKARSAVAGAGSARRALAPASARATLWRSRRGCDSEPARFRLERYGNQQLHQQPALSAPFFRR